MFSREKHLVTLQSESGIPLSNSLHGLRCVFSSMEAGPVLRGIWVRGHGRPLPWKRPDWWWDGHQGIRLIVSGL